MVLPKYGDDDKGSRIRYASVGTDTETNENDYYPSYYSRDAIKPKNKIRNPLARIKLKNVASLK